MLKFKKQNVMGDTVHTSIELLVPFSSVRTKSNTKVEKFAIIKSKHDDCFEVGVWDSNTHTYDTISYADCNCKTLKETIEKVSAKYKRGR